VAQILLTRNDIADRTQYLNAQNTLRELLAMGVIPIVNENDTLAVTEIKFGDNDTLSAITAAMIQADYLFLMTDVDCLYDRNPRKFPDALPIEVVEDIDSLQADVSSAGSNLGTGGMATKIVAARLATSAGTTTIITRSSKPNNVSEIISYLHPPTEPLPLSPAKATVINVASTAQISSSSTKATPPSHTRFLPSLTPIRNRAFWILHGLAPHGTIYIDRGATTALMNKAGLLPVGVVGVEGHFAQQEAVRLVAVDRSALPVMGSLSPAEGLADTESLAARNGGGRPLSLSASALAMLVAKGEEVGRAVVNYSSAEVARIKGLRSGEIIDVLGYADSEYVAFRENVSLFGVDKSRPETPTRVQTPLGTRTAERGGAEQTERKEAEEVAPQSS
jgi:glutamate 5-kinase